MKKNRTWKKWTGAGVCAALFVVEMWGGLSHTARAEQTSNIQMQVKKEAVWTEQADFLGTLNIEISGLQQEREEQAVISWPDVVNEEENKESPEPEMEATTPEEEKAGIDMEEAAMRIDESMQEPDFVEAESPETDTANGESESDRTYEETLSNEMGQEEGNTQAEAGDTDHTEEQEENTGLEEPWGEGACTEEESTVCCAETAAADFLNDGQSEDSFTTDAVCAAYEQQQFTACISEYFQLANTEGGLPQGVATEEIPVKNQAGRETTLTKITYDITETDRAQGVVSLSLPIFLRREYRYPAQAVTLPVLQDDASVTLEVPAAKTDFAVSLTQEEESPKAGRKLTYHLVLTNTGEADLEKLVLVLSVADKELQPAWEAQDGLEIQENSAVLSQLAKGAVRELNFTVTPGEGDDGTMLVNAAVTATSAGGEQIRKEVMVSTSVQPLKADFTVEKTADCEEACPGETITYQICITNTGERTLHSVVGTERFLDSNIRARFAAAEGIKLNQAGTKALIPQILPGESVGLTAVVTIPENLENADLINQVTVISDETGEKEIKSQAKVQIRSDAEQITEAPDSGEDSTAEYSLEKEAPQTGDHSYKGLYELAMISAFLVSLRSAFCLYRKRQ